MPISEYFSGHGEDVLRKMRRRYGAKRGTRIFYATANARRQTPRRRRRSR